MDINDIVYNFLKGNKQFIALYMIFMFVYPATSVVLPSYYSKNIEEIKAGVKPTFDKTLGVIVGLNIIFFILEKIDTHFIPKIQSYVYMNIVEKILETNKNHFGELNIGELMSMIVKLPIVIRDLFRQLRNYIIPIFLILGVTALRFYIINPRLGTLFAVSVLVLSTMLFTRLFDCFHMSKNMNNHNDVVTEHISDVFSNTMDIYMMNMLSDEINRLDKLQQDSDKRYKQTFTKTNNFRFIMTTSFTGLILFCIKFAYTEHKRGTINLTDMITITLTAIFVINKIGGISAELPDFVFNLGVYMKIRTYILDLPGDKINTDNTVKSLALPSETSKEFKKGGLASIKFDNVGIRYGQKQVIKGFDAHIDSGSSLCILGGIGKGKSSIVKALLGFVPISEGRITLGGYNINEVDSDLIQSRIIFVRQNPVPFNRTLLENIMYGNRQITESDVIRVFNMYNLHNFFSVGLHDSVGKKGERLSGGQKQMIFLIRVILSDRDIVILDEPTSALDDRTSNYIMNIL